MAHSARYARIRSTPHGRGIAQGPRGGEAVRGAVDALSDHFDGKRFVNPSGTAKQPLAAVPRLLLERRTPWPSRVDEPTRRPPALDGAAALVSFIGHATFLIQTAAGNILTDPMYSQRAGPLNLLGPRRVRQPAVRFDDLPPISTVLLSHNH